MIRYELVCSAIRLSGGLAVVVLITTIAFSQDGNARVNSDGITSLASTTEKCLPKTIATQPSLQADPGAKITPDKMSLRVVDDSPKYNESEGTFVHEGPLSTTVEHLTGESKKPAQCEPKTSAASFRE
jgi:hypothetical protein